MPNLNDTQKNFRKQMEELKKDDNIIDVMIDNDSFYNNKAYKDRTKYKRKNNIIKLFYFAIILSLLTPSIINNKDLIINNINSIKSINNQTSIINFFKSVSPEEINQNKIGTYHNNYTNKVTELSLSYDYLTKEISFPNYNIIDMGTQLNLVKNHIIEFEKYKPDDINKELHLYNIRILYSLRDNYNYKIDAACNYSAESTLIYKTGDQYNLYENKRRFREILLNIFQEYNIKYTIFEDNTIRFYYPLL